MTREEAKEIFLNRGYEQVDGGSIYNPDKWRESVIVISDWLRQDCDDAISRADAIKAVTTMCEEYTPTKSTYHPHIDFVVEELNKLPSVRPKSAECEDAISRQAVLELQYRIDDSATLSTRDVVNVEDIEGLPPFTPQPKTGHWRAVYQGDCIINYRCSECEFGNTFGKNTYRMNYCPNCGAKMVEPQESEDKE